MSIISGRRISLGVKRFLELAQPLSVKYGYSRGIKGKDPIVTYRDMGSSQRYAVGGKIISEKRTYLVTIQTTTAELNLYYSTMIKFAAEGSHIAFVQEDLRKDVTVEDGWINSIILSAYNAGEDNGAYTPTEVREMLQLIADNYLFVTSIYRGTLEDSFIDSMVVPELEDKLYSYAQVLQLKQEYLDKIVLEITSF